MRRHGYNLGGEQSGHLVFLDHATTGDGIVAALRVLAVMVREGRPLSELAAVMTKSPQVLVNVQASTASVPLDELADGRATLIRQAERRRWATTAASWSATAAPSPRCGS
jgi:phosphoglucosamine mutase